MRRGFPCQAEVAGEGILIILVYVALHNANDDYRECDLCLHTNPKRERGKRSPRSRFGLVIAA